MANILVADDNQQIASILEEYLKKEGHTPHIARDGEEALALFGKLKPDAVLLDVMMPKLDGFAVCREIRKTSAVPIIMVTARGEDFERIMGLDTGADDYIVKPFSPRELVSRINAVLRRGAPVAAATNIEFDGFVARDASPPPTGYIIQITLDILTTYGLLTEFLPPHGYVH